MKPTAGTTPMDGVMVISDYFDTLGAMAKTVSDLVILVQYLQDQETDHISVQKDWSGLRLGVVDPEKWFLPPSLVKPIEEVHKQIVCLCHPDHVYRHGFRSDLTETSRNPRLKIALILAETTEVE
jgi:Asp-tRNA(Asn)/Glu-tRNA(Gln) amidotransferase A subunit family amidase